MFEAKIDREHHPANTIKKKSLLDGHEVGDVIGSFGGIVNRAKTKREGLTAQIFGENGRDADVITALHLTQYQDLPVKVSVWGVKDKNGALMKENGKPPKITEFIAKIERPSPKKEGQMALFFGDNGENADAINILNQTQYLDALVYVEIQLADPESTIKDIKTIDPTEDLKKEGQRMTASEIKQMRQMQKMYREAESILRKDGFYRNERVMAQIGKDQDYMEWVTTQPCCHPMGPGLKCDHTDIVAFSTSDKGKYMYIPFCTEHVKEWEQGIANVASPREYMRSRKYAFNTQWTYEMLKKILEVDDEHEIPPRKMADWAMSKGIYNLLPMAYTMYVNKDQ